jgi:hypothetical protein
MPDHTRRSGLITSAPLQNIARRPLIPQRYARICETLNLVDSAPTPSEYFRRLGSKNPMKRSPFARCTRRLVLSTARTGDRNSCLDDTGGWTHPRHTAPYAAGSRRGAMVGPDRRHDDMRNPDRRFPDKRRLGALLRAGDSGRPNDHLVGRRALPDISNHGRPTREQACRVRPRGRPLEAKMDKKTLRTVLATAEALCAQRNVGFTRQRRRCLELVCQAERPRLRRCPD